MLYSTSRQIHLFKPGTRGKFPLAHPSNLAPPTSFIERCRAFFTWIVRHGIRVCLKTGYIASWLGKVMICKTSDVGSFPSFQTNPYPRTIITSMLVPHRILYIYPHIISYPIGQLLGVPTLRSSIPVDPSLVRHPASLLSVPVVVVSGVTLLALLGL